MTDQAFRQGVTEIVGEIRQLRGSIDAVLSALTTAPPEPPDACEHPPDARIALSGMGGDDLWQCRDCGATCAATAEGG